MDKFVKLEKQKEHVSYINFDKCDWLLTYFFKFTEEGFRNKLLRWVVKDDQPLLVVEGEAFKDMMSYAAPKAHIPSADTLRRDLHNNYELVKEQVRQNLQVGGFNYKMVLFVIIG